MKLHQLGQLMLSYFVLTQLDRSIWIIVSLLLKYIYSNKEIPHPLLQPIFLLLIALTFTHQS